jgi:hypothetical protein
MTGGCRYSMPFRGVSPFDHSPMNIRALAFGSTSMRQEGVKGKVDSSTVDEPEDHWRYAVVCRYRVWCRKMRTVRSRSAMNLGRVTLSRARVSGPNSRLPPCGEKAGAGDKGLKAEYHSDALPRLATPLSCYPNSMP